jgi:hypothetical protein
LHPVLPGFEQRQTLDSKVPLDIIETALAAAETAPSGANLQPWHFVAVIAVFAQKFARRTSGPFLLLVTGYPAPVCPTPAEGADDIRQLCR